MDILFIIPNENSIYFRDQTDLNVLIAEADHSYWIVVCHSHIFSIRQFVAHLTSIVYVSDITCDKETRSCLSLHVLVLMLFVFFFLTLPFVQENSRCLILPVFKKVLRVRNYLCSRDMNISAISCVQKTCTCTSLPVGRKLSVYAKYFAK